MACETKQVKLVVIAIGCIQKLITFNAIPQVNADETVYIRAGYFVLANGSTVQQSVNAILKTLNDIMIHGIELQLKILQTILPLLTNYHTIHGDVLAEVIHHFTYSPS